MQHNWLIILFVLKVEYSIILVILCDIFFVFVITIAIVVFNAANCFVISNVIFVIVAVAATVTVTAATAAIINYIFIVAATIIAIFF